MSEKEIIAYAITHAGRTPEGKAIKGGPYESWGGDAGEPCRALADAFRIEHRDMAEEIAADARNAGAKHARVIRIVRARPSSPCPVHADQEHGREAEELRRGIEKILADALPAWDYIEQGDRDDDVICARDLKRLIERVDARDSVAYLERKTRLSPSEIAAMVGAQKRMPIVPTQRPSEASATLETARRRLAAVAESMTEHAYQEMASALEVDACRVEPSEASAVEVLRALLPMIWDPTTCDNPGCLGCLAYANARRVLAASGPDPMPLARAAMAETEVEAEFFRAERMSEFLAVPRQNLNEVREERRAAVDAYRKAGGK